ncbi:MAG: small multi-drug export protein [Lachnospiraceae bacterium]|nr:small multi-drug export protein [Lachnospiraceae bacterium]
MTSIIEWFTATLSDYISREAVIFIISLLPILELRGGLLAAKLLGVGILQAIPICVLGNIIPIPFILLFIKKILQWMKGVKLFAPVALWLEKKAMGKSDQVKKYEFWGLTLFVGIPLPGTGGWTGALIASLMDIDIKKASLSILLGIAIATVIMSFVSYGLLGVLIG